MNDYIAKLFLEHLDYGELSVGHAPPHVKEWLEGLDISMDVRRFIQWNWPQKSCVIAGVCMFTPEQMQSFDFIDAFLTDKLFPLGYGPNGDTFAIDFSVESHPVGFVNFGYGHENPREHLIYAARSLETFLYRVTEGRFVPFDGGSANFFNFFLEAEATHENFPPYRPMTRTAPPEASDGSGSS